MLRSWVEKPPSPTAEKAWQMASNHDMPQMRSAAMPARVMSAYTSHSDFAVSVMRGASRSSFIGPGACSLYSCMPPTRSEEHTSELQSLAYLVCRLLLEKKKTKPTSTA